MLNTLRRVLGRPSVPAPVEIDLEPWVAAARAPRGNAHLVLAQLEASEASLERRLPGQPSYGAWAHPITCRCSGCR